MMYTPRASCFVLLAVLVIAASVRFFVAPISAGPDVAQFWAFAKVFKSSGIDFYRYAGATLDIFPFKWWGFFYPPVWLLFLGLCLAVVPESLASATIVDLSWRLAMKTPIIIADLVLGILLYRNVSGSQARKLIFASLWLFNPTAWYESSIFGQFDAIAAAFLFASVMLFEKGRYGSSFVLAGLAFMTKQHTLMALAPVFAIGMRRMGLRHFLRKSLLFLGVLAFLSLPFVLTGNALSYVRSILLPGQGPSYQHPLVYAFSGTGSLLTYLHDLFGWDTAAFLQLNMPLLVVAFSVAVLVSFLRLESVVESSLIGFLLFIGLSYQVNYQYLIVYIPLALLAASRATGTLMKTSALLLALLPSLWLWIFDVSFWFRYFHPATDQMTPMLSLMGLTRYASDYVYVSFALVLMILSLFYAYIALRAELRRSLTKNAQIEHPAVRSSVEES